MEKSQTVCGRIIGIESNCEGRNYVDLEIYPIGFPVSVIKHIPVIGDVVLTGRQKVKIKIEFGNLNEWPE